MLEEILGGEEMKYNKVEKCGDCRFIFTGFFKKICYLPSRKDEPMQELEVAGDQAPPDWCPLPDLPDVETQEQKQKNKDAIALIQKWLDDNSGYDEAVWPEIKKAMEEL